MTFLPVIKQGDGLSGGAECYTMVISDNHCVLPEEDEEFDVHSLLT